MSERAVVALTRLFLTTNVNDCSIRDVSLVRIGVNSLARTRRTSQSQLISSFPSFHPVQIERLLENPDFTAIAKNVQPSRKKLRSRHKVFSSEVQISEEKAESIKFTVCFYNFGDRLRSIVKSPFGELGGIILIIKETYLSVAGNFQKKGIKSEISSNRFPMIIKTNTFFLGRKIRARNLYKIL